MSDTGKQSPLGVNSLNSLLNVQGLQINPKFVSWAGTSHNFPNYTFGKVVQDTVLRVITHAIHEGYVGHTDITGTDGWPTSTVYNNLISIGGGTNSISITSITSGVISGTDQYYFDVVYNQSFVLSPGTYIRINGASPAGYNGNWIVETSSPGTFRVYSTVSYGVSTTGSFVIDTQVPGLGNAKAMVYTWEELIGRFGTGSFNLGDSKGWGGSLYKNNRPLPATSNADTANPATQWAYLRLLPLQAWMEFNYNSTLEQGDSLNQAGYRDFLQQWQSCYGFISYSNSAILSVDNSKDFLSGTYSNMNDLISADITNVSLATKAFGQDLIALGKAIDLSTIATYGLPSNLLKTLAKYNSLTKNLSLAIITAGIPVDELGSILSNITQPTLDQERKLYAAYYITVGETLDEVLIPLNCKTPGLTSLVDLLNPAKLFPNSYKTLTVQLYNTGTQNGAQNSKVAFPIYSSSGTINSDLTSTQVLNQIGSQTTIGTPLINNVTPIATELSIEQQRNEINNDNINSTNTIGSVQIQSPAKGYGSYLSSIIPPDIAVAAGAFSAGMQQIRNIQEVQIEKFAQVVTNIETMVGLNTNSDSNNLVPTNLPLRTLGRPKIALGSGPQGSYTMSDFFGCMSGLPYNGPLSNIYDKLTQVATRKLFNIYHETYLAVTYQRAKMSISQPVYNVLVQSYIPADPSAIPPVAGQPRIDDWYYTISFAVANTGGGYGRGTAPAPAITITPNNVGASATCTIGTDDNNIPGNFGRVKELTTNFGSPYKYTTTSVSQSGPPSAPTPPQETIYIELPPADYLPIQANGNIATSGLNIPLGYGTGSLGTIVTGIAQWPFMNEVIQQYINQANTEISAILAANPAACQSLNSSWNSTGAQLTIEQRARQEGLKPPLDDIRQNFLSLFPNTIYGFIDSVPQYGKNTEPHMYAQTLENISNWNTTGGQSIVGMMREHRNQDRLAALGVALDNNIPDQLPYDQQKILISNGTLPTGVANPNIPSGSTIAEPTAPVTPTTTPTSNPIIIRDDVDITPQPAGIVDEGTGDYIVTNPEYRDVGSTAGVGNTPGVGNTLGVGNTDISDVLDVGNAVVPGSFAGSPYVDLIPPNLNSWYSSSTLMPSTYTVNEAIEEVILCNCDCWNLA